MTLKLVLVRHAHAGDRKEFAKTGKPDELRPLSQIGIRQMEDAAPRLLTLIADCDKILSSKYLRARQTASIIADAWGKTVTENSLLEPEGRVSKFLSAIRGAEGTVLAVGHEPQLGALAAWLISGSEEPALEFSKGGVCLLEFSGLPRPGKARLRWFMGPKQLAKLPAVPQSPGEARTIV